MSVIYFVMNLKASERESKWTEDVCNFHRDCLEERHGSYHGLVALQHIFSQASLKVIYHFLNLLQFSKFHSLSHVWLFSTPWTAARQVSLSITNSRSLHKLMSIEAVMPSNHLILCRPLLLSPSIFPSIRGFSNESVLCIMWQNIGVSASTSVLPMNTQDWSSLGWTDWISLQPKGCSRIFYNTTVQKHQFFSAQLSS